MAKYLPLPDGSTVPVPDDMSYDEAIAKAREQYPEAFEPAAKPESGFVAASKSGLAGLKADIATLAGRTGVMDPAAAEKYIEEQKRYQRRTFKPTETWGEAPVRKGLELLGGSLPYMAAPVVAGGAAALGGAPAAVGIGAAGLTSAAQFTGSNLSRQIEEGKKLQETELGSAALAAVPQAALDMLSFKMMPAIRGIFGAAGKELTKEGAETIAKQSLSKAAADYTKATGKAMSAEGLTEAAQQVLERMQAGLNLTNQQARDEYLESLIGGAVLGGALAPAGRYIERRGEARRQEQVALAKAQEEAAAAAAAEEKRKSDPEYVLQFVKDYEAKEQAFVQARKDLKKPGKDATPSEWEIYKEQRQALDEQRKELTEQSAEYRRLKTIATPLLAEAAAAKRDQEIKDELERLRAEQKGQTVLPGFEAETVTPPETAAPEDTTDYAREVRLLTARQAELNARVLSAKNVNELLEATRLANENKAALSAAKKGAALSAVPKPKSRVDTLKEQLAAAQKKQNYAEVNRIAEELKSLGVTDLTAPTETEKAQAQEEMPLFPFKSTTTTKQDWAATKYQPGAPDIEAQEQETLADAERQRQESEAEAARERKVAPEINALTRIRERPAGLTNITAGLSAQPTPTEPQGSAAMAMMNQRLRLEADLTAAREALVKARRAFDGTPYTQAALTRAENNLAAAQKRYDEARADMLQGELIPTAEEEKTPEETTRKIQRAPSTGFKLFPRQGEPERPSDYQNLAMRLASALARNDIDQTTYDFLRRAERVLPTIDQRIETARQTRTPTGTASDVASTEGFLTLLDQQLDLIERNQEGVLTGQRFVETERKRAPGAQAELAPATTASGRDISAYSEMGPASAAAEASKRRNIKAEKGESQRVSFPGAPVTERTKATTGRTLRMPAKPLSLAGEMEPLLRLQEQLAGPDLSESTQGELFKDDTTGVVRSTPANFRRFMQSKEVQALRAALPKTAVDIKRQQQAIPALQKRVDELKKRVEEMDKAAQKYKTAQAVLKANKDLANLQRSIEDIQRTITARVVDRLNLEKQISDIGFELGRLEGARAAFIAPDKIVVKNKTKSIRLGVGAPQLMEMAAEYRGEELSTDLLEIENRVQALRAEMDALLSARIELDSGLNELNRYVQVVEARNKITELQERAPFGYEMDQAKEQLRAAQANLADAQQKAGTAQAELIAKQAQERRQQEAIAQARRIDASNERAKEEQKRLEAMYSKEAEGQQVFADPLVQARQLAQTLGEPEYTEIERRRLMVEPEKVLAGYRSRIKAIEKQIAKAAQTSLAARDASLNRIRAELDALEKAYKAATSADARAALLPQIEKAAFAVERRTDKLGLKGRFIWKGYAAQQRALATVLNKADVLEEQIKTGVVVPKEAQPTRAAIRIESAAEKAEAAAEKEKADTKEAAKRAGAPTTSGEPLTRTEAKKAGEAKKTVYTGKGVGTDVKVSDKKPLLSTGAQKGTGTDAKTVRKEIKRALGTLPDTNKVEIFETVEEARAALLRSNTNAKNLRKQLKDLDIPDDAKGFAYKGKAYLIAENIGNKESVGVLLHELGAHIGLRNIFSQGQINGLANAIRTWASRTDNSTETQIAKKAMDRLLQAKTSPEHANDELIAYAVEEAFYAGIEPAGVSGGTALERWMRTVVNAFKKALETFGINPDNLKVGDLVNMAYGAAQLELRGTWHGTGKPFTEFDFKYVGSGEGAQVYGWGTYIAQLRSTAENYQKKEAKKALIEWAKSPEMRAWAEKNSIKWNGKSAAEWQYLAHSLDRAYEMEDAVKFAAIEKEMHGLSSDQAESLASWLRAADEDLVDSIQTGYYESASFENALNTAFKWNVNAEAQKELSQINADRSKFMGPSAVVRYKGFSFFDLDEKEKERKLTPTEEAVKNVLLEIKVTKNNKLISAEQFKKEIRKVLDSYRAYLKTRAERSSLFSKSKYVQDIDYWKEAWKKDSALLEGITNLTPDDFDYDPPTPIPEPPEKVGTILRVLQRAADDEYLRYDVDAETAQSKVVTDGMLKATASLNKAQLHRFESRYRSASSKQTGSDFYVALSKALGSDEAASKLLRSFGVAGVKYADGWTRNKEGKKTYNFVDFFDKEEGSAVIPVATNPAGQDKAVLFSIAPKYASPALSAAGEVAKRVIAPQRTAMDAIKGEGVGLKFQTQFVDRFAPLEVLSKYMDKLKGLQMMYYLRMFDQRMNFVAQSVGNGALRRVEKTRADGRKEYVIESQGGANLKNVVNTVKEANALVGSAEGNSNLFSMYLIAKRAERVGLSKLNYGGKITEADLQKVRDAVGNTPGLENIYKRAQTEYNQYNRDMLQFAVDSGAMSAGERAALISAGDYVPYYRERNGAFEMMLGDRPIARIGNTKEQPYLKELVGGEEPIIDFMTSAVQNTNMLTDMSLRNIATKSAVFELQALGMAKIGKGHGASGPDVVKFREHGEEKHAFITSENVVIGGKKIPTGVPADLLVKGMEGVPFQTTLITKLMGGPARTLRKMVVLNPLYAARQLFRDSLAAPITSGADFLPVFGALRQVGSATGKTLEQRGITGGQVFSGSQEDLSMILRDIASNKSSWAQGINKLEHLSKAADASTRRAQYNSYIKQGMSEMEATYLSLESMNFSKRGVNPAVHALMHSIPFFNAQVQALNVLYKAFTGKMSFNEKLQIREKLFQRGMMVATFTMVYAALMQDDETYRNATPEQKYGNWFIPIPGLKEPLRLPIPFEIGYIFKAIPEAIVNTMMSKHGGEEAAKAFKHIAVQIIPGGSNMVKFGDVPIPLPVPQALKPVLEVGLNKSFYTGRELESAHEQSLEPGYRSRDKTSALAKVVGENLNISPIKIDALISGYFSTTGLLLADALSFAMPSPDIAEPTKRLSDMRVIGGLFQPKDASGIINATYERLKDAEKVKNTYNELLKSGKVEEARTYLQDNMQQYIEASVENKFSSYMQKVSQAEKAIRASSSLSPDEKRERLDSMRQLKIRVAEIYRNTADSIAESRR